MKIIEFAKFKLVREDFRFRSKKEMNNYFNNLLAESDTYHGKEKFRREQLNYLYEGLNIIFSWSVLLGLIGGVILIVNLFKYYLGIYFLSIFSGVPLILIVGGLILYQLFKKRAESTLITESFLSNEFIDEARIILKNKKYYGNKINR